MDPISLLLGALILTGFARVGIAITADAYATVKAAQAGAWDVIDRQRERRASFWQRVGAAWAARRAARHRSAGGDGNYRPGARAYAADLYHGFWEDQLEKRAARRAARGPYVFDPDRLSWADRFDAAVMRKVTTLRERWGQRAAEPVEDTPLDELLTHDDPAPHPVDHEPGTWTYNDRGERVELTPTATTEEETPTSKPEGDTMPTPTGEIIDVTGAVNVCKNLTLSMVTLRERYSAEAAAAEADLDSMARAAETLDASARDLEFDPATLDSSAATFEAISAAKAAIAQAKAAIAQACEQVTAATSNQQREFEKHLPGVEFNAAVGGMAKKEAYQGA